MASQPLVQDDTRLRAEVPAAPYPLLFATISGAHLYGFASSDSDIDLRGVHVLPPREVLGLDLGPETIQSSHLRDGAEIDLVMHDARKFFELLLRRNGYVLEQLYSPLVVHTTPAHEELKQVARGCITRHHAHHHLGFAATQVRLVQKERVPRLKPVLYVYRVLMTGIHLMRTGEVEANVVRLNETVFRLPSLADLIARKVDGSEHAVLDQPEVAFHLAEFERLRAQLEDAHRTTALPEGPIARPALHDLLLRVRLPAGE